MLGTWEEEERRLRETQPSVKGLEKIFEEIVVENFPNMGKESLT